MALEGLHERVAQVEDLKNEGFPYRDALRARAEIQMRATIRSVFGERSHEFQRLKNFTIQSTDEGEIAHALIILQDLILIIENRRRNILGLAPAAPSTAVNTTAESAPDTYQSPAPHPPLSSAHSVSTPSRQHIQPSSSTPTASAHHAPGAAPPKRTKTNPTPISQKPRASPRSVTETVVMNTEVTASLSRIDLHLPHLASSAPAPSTPSIQPLTPVEAAFARIHVIANRFHAVARQLRLRRDYRTTLEVEDQYDVQDLFGSLLKVDFEEVGSEEWMPDYGGFSSQSTFFVAKGQLALILKKTRPGWGPRDLHAELAVAIERYATYPECTALLCFVYDPEGRIGNPASLEEQLTKQDKGLSITTLISPK